MSAARHISEGQLQMFDPNTATVAYQQGERNRVAQADAAWSSHLAHPEFRRSWSDHPVEMVRQGYARAYRGRTP